MGLVAKRKEAAAQVFKSYSKEQKTLLEEKYTPAQMKAIEAGERAIDPLDLEERGIVRTDIGALSYYEDFSKTRSMLDRPQRYEGPIHPSTRPMTSEEVMDRERFHLNKILAAKPPPPPGVDPLSQEYDSYMAPTRIDQMKAESLTEVFIDKDGYVPLNKMGYSYEAPGLPINIFGGEELTKAKEQDKVDQRDPDGIYNRLMQQTGMTLDDIMKLKVKILVKHRVVNQTRLGKIASLYCLAIAGNQNGLLGIGQAKGQEIEETQNNARITAIRNMKPVPRYEQRTIFGEVEAKLSAVEVKLRSRPPGFGLRCNHRIFEMARAAGIDDLSAKVPRSRNPMNTVKATYQALMSQRIPDEVARGLGKKLVDVRKVYYGGRV